MAGNQKGQLPIKAGSLKLKKWSNITKSTDC